MAASIGLVMNPPHITEERAVFTQLKPVRMSGAEGAEDASVFEDVKPAVRVRYRVGKAGTWSRPRVPVRQPRMCPRCCVSAKAKVPFSCL